MASYVVMEPPAGGRGQQEVVLVRDGFYFLAFLLPVLWLLWHRLWLEALAAFAALAALVALAAYGGFGMTTFVLALLVRFYVGMEGAALRLARYRRRGWREWGVVEAETIRDAEIRYLTQAPDEADEPAALPTPFQRAAPPRVSVGPALGMLGYPGRV